VTVYSSLYLRSTRKVLELLDDERRTTLPTIKQCILDTFDKIKAIIEKAQEYDFLVKDATINTAGSTCSIMEPTEDKLLLSSHRSILINLRFTTL